MDDIFVFTMDGCNHCISLKEHLKTKGVKFSEIEINSNREIWSQVVSQTGENILPTVYIRKNGTDNGPVFIPGKDFKSPEELYENIKIYL